MFSFNILRVLGHHHHEIATNSTTTTPRETTKECYIGGYEIPTKTLVYVSAWAVGRDPEALENPYEFDPDRFLGSSIDLKGKKKKSNPICGEEGRYRH